jgi:hypothetical protein
MAYVLFPATIVPDPTQPAGEIGTLPKHLSNDSGYAEGGKGIPYYQRSMEILAKHPSLDSAYGEGGKRIP